MKTKPVSIRPMRRTRKCLALVALIALPTWIQSHSKVGAQSELFASTERNRLFGIEFWRSVRQGGRVSLREGEVAQIAYSGGSRIIVGSGSTLLFERNALVPQDVSLIAGRYLVQSETAVITLNIRDCVLTLDQAIISVVARDSVMVLFSSGAGTTTIADGDSSKTIGSSGAVLRGPCDGTGEVLTNSAPTEVETQEIQALRADNLAEDLAQLTPVWVRPEQAQGSISGIADVTTQDAKSVVMVERPVHKGAAVLDVIETALPEHDTTAEFQSGHLANANVDSEGAVATAGSLGGSVLTFCITDGCEDPTGRVSIAVSADQQGEGTPYYELLNLSGTETLAFFYEDSIFYHQEIEMDEAEVISLVDVFELPRGVTLKVKDDLLKIAPLAGDFPTLDSAYSGISTILQSGEAAENPSLGPFALKIAPTSLGERNSPAHFIAAQKVAFGQTELDFAGFPANAQDGTPDVAPFSVHAPTGPDTMVSIATIDAFDEAAAETIQATVEGDLSSVRDYENLHWGFISGRIDLGEVQENQLGLVGWVGGERMDPADIPFTGVVQYYSGHAFGNVLDEAGLRNVLGTYSNEWDFANRTGTAELDFDNQAFEFETRFGSGGFEGDFSSATRQGAVRGTFFSPGVDNAPNSLGGTFVINQSTGDFYEARGAFAAER